MRKLKNFLRLSSISNRLTLSFGLIIILCLLVNFFALQVILTLKKNYDSSQEIFQPAQYYSHEILKSLYEVHSTLQELTFLHRGNYTQEAAIAKVKIDNIWKDEINIYTDTLNQTLEKYNDRTSQDIFYEVKKHIHHLHQASDIAIKFMKDKHLLHYQTDVLYNPLLITAVDSSLYYNPELVRRLEIDFYPVYEQVEEVLGELLDKVKVIEKGRELWLERKFYLWISIAIGAIILMLGSVFVVIYLNQRYIMQDVDAVHEYMHELLEGNIPHATNYRNKEFSPLTISMNSLKKKLTDLQNFASKVSEDELGQDIKLLGDKGSLGGALAKMRDDLKKISEENQIRYWQNNGIAKFSKIVTQYAGDLQKLTSEVINNLVEYLAINQGGLFVIEEEEGKLSLHLKAAYAYNKQKYLQKNIEKGQGLLGQTWNEGTSLYLQNVPPDYVEVTSGLGGATPRVLLIVPLKSKEEVHGMIEVASFEEIPAYKQELVKKVAENVGEIIAGVRINERTKRLLIESQNLAQTLQMQEEQLRENMRDLEETQFKMNFTQKELKEKEANLDAVVNNTSHAIIAFDKDYTITVVNRSMRQLYLDSDSIRLEVGKNMIDEMPQEDLEKHKIEYERVLSGEKFVVLRESERREQKSFFELHYNPIYGENKDTIGASIFIENITQQKQAEIHLKETQANLTSLINDTEDAIMAIDKEYKIIVANEVVKKFYQDRNKNLEEDRSVFDYISHYDTDKWKGFYDRALQGERFLKVIESGKFPDKTYREYWFNPVRNDREEVTGVSIFSRDVTENKKSEVKVRQLLLESLEATEKLKEQEEEMKKQIAEYERRIKELEKRIW